MQLILLSFSYFSELHPVVPSVALDVCKLAAKAAF
jgi:hypothetical protein